MPIERIKRLGQTARDKASIFVAGAAGDLLFRLAAAMEVSNDSDSRWQHLSHHRYAIGCVSFDN